MTVKEYLSRNISLEEFEEISDYNDYWYNSYKFYFENRDKEVSELTTKQKDWLYKIARGLADELII